MSSMVGEIRPTAHEQLAPDLHELQQSLREVIEAMRDVSRTSGAPNAHRFVSEELVDRLRLAADRTNGALIEAGSEVSSYYVMADERQERFERGKFRPHFHSLTPFYGIQRGIEEVSIGEEGEKRYLCLAVDPLYTTFDREITGYFANRGRVNHLIQPFGLPEHTHQRLWVPVFDIGPDSLQPLHMPGRSTAQQ